METEQSEPPRCSNCRFYAAHNKWHGLCRRHPPTPILSAMDRFPKTKPTDWCGEYEQTIQPQEE